MKTRFSTYDLICSVAELQKYIGLRVNQIYDIDHKTYLIRLQKTDEKIVILLESGSRIHTTDYEWPKNMAPSGFSMKLRKHLRNKRLESLTQLRCDRIVDLQFGSGDAEHHIFLELYDKGNIILTDCNLTILNIWRPHTEGNTDGNQINLAVRQIYPIDRARGSRDPPSEEAMRTILANAKPGDNLKKILNPHLEYGPAIIEHMLLGVGLNGNCRIGKGFIIETDLSKLMTAFAEAEDMLNKGSVEPSKGYIIQKLEKRPTADGKTENFFVNQEFHPFLYRQHAENPHAEFDSFVKAVDHFFSSMESQKIDIKAINQEKDAMKKLENVRRDHDKRLVQLSKTQEFDRVKAELITKNQELVDKAIMAVRSAIANQMAWPDIQTLVKEAKQQGDPVAQHIKQLRLDINHITLELSDPYCESSEEEEEDNAEGNEEDFTKLGKKSLPIDIDLDLTAFANARKFYDQKRTAAKKQQKTIESQGKALKSAEKKTKQTLKEMKAIVNISKVRKVLWFEKFFWFISSENYLVIGGRDMAQNELIVKRYMRPADVYVHADIHGASSVIIKNPTGEPVPPKTLNEAGVMAISYSVAWDAKVVTTAWWVQADKVSKSAPSGESLPTGSFIIRGKKNYLPPGNLIMGFSFLFKLEESSIPRHKDERRVKSLEEEVKNVAVDQPEEQDVEIVLSEDEDDKDDKDDKEDQEDQEDQEGKEDNEKDEPQEKLKSIEEGNEESETEKDLFPDTEIKIHHTGKEISLEAKSSVSNQVEKEEETVVFLGDRKPVVVKQTHPKKQKQQKQQQKQQKEAEKTSQEESNKEEGKIKRGKRGKLKKMKEKYKFQDEEDRQQRLEILQNIGSKKAGKDKDKDKDKANNTETKKLEKTDKSEKAAPKQKNDAHAKESGDESGDEAQEPGVNTDVEILFSLTGVPVTEDELLFAVPVVAPYNTLQNYKFKVKLTPGTGKRGKAARTALDIFLKDKTCSQREKELLKSVKDETLARNLPGKVKVSAPHLHKK